MLFIISFCFSVLDVFWTKLSKVRLSQSESDITWNTSLSASNLSALALSSEIFPSLSTNLVALEARAWWISSTWDSDSQLNNSQTEQGWPDLELPAASCPQLCPAALRQVPTTIMWRDMLQLLCGSERQNSDQAWTWQNWRDLVVIFILYEGPPALHRQWILWQI